MSDVCESGRSPEVDLTSSIGLLQKVFRQDKSLICPLSFFFREKILAPSGVRTWVSLKTEDTSEDTKK